MSDQQAPTNVDTPAVAGPTEAPGTAQDTQQVQDTGYEQRYKDLQAEYTRSQQAFKEAQEREQWYRELVTSDDPDTQRRAAEILGFELPDEDELDEFAGAEEFEPDGPEYMTRAEFEEFRRQEQAQQQQQMAQEFTTDWAHQQFDELGVEGDQTRAFIFAQALAMPPARPQPGMPVDSLPDIRGAYEQYQAWRDEEMRNWAKTKRAPHVPAGGLPANEVPDSGTGHNSRVARALMRLHNDAGDEQ